MSCRIKLPKVDCSRGAPMGRADRWAANWKSLKPLMLTKLDRDSGGYDSGGAYFGLDHAVGTQWECLWVCYSRETDEQGMPLVFITTWAKSRRAAWGNMVTKFPGVVCLGLVSTKGMR